MMIRLTVTVFLSSYLLLIAQSAFANINMSKNRLFFDSNQRGNSLQLRNAGANTMNYTASLHLVEMTEDGSLQRVKDATDSAIKMIRFSPKRGSIKPGDAQVVRFAVRRSPKLASGEYRAVFSLVSAIDNTSESSVSLNTKLAYNMPVIVRHGETTATTALEKPRLVMQGDVPHIELWQTLEGNRSLFGNFIITDENQKEIGSIKRVAMYSQLSQRKVVIPLRENVNGGNVYIKYQEIAEFGGNLTASAALQL